MKNQTQNQTHNQNQNQTAPSQLEAETQTAHPPGGSRPRVGKIARLPEDIREELNERLEEGEGGDTLLDWLNGLPETRRLLKREFDGHPISKQNLSDWRRGGFAEWTLRRDLVEQAGELASQASEIAETGGPLLADNLLTVFIARYAALLLRWEGEASEEFSARVRLFSRIRRDLLHLQGGAQEAARHARAEEERQKEERRRDDEEARRFALAPLRAAQRRSTVIQVYGEEVGEQMADLMDAVDFGDHPLFAQGWFQGGKSQATQEGGDTKTGQGNAPSASPSQAMANPPQATESERVPAQTPSSESRPVKPFSEVPGEGGLPGRNGGNGGNGEKGGDGQKG